MPSEGDVKLTGADSLSAGCVEVFHSGQWGRVCQCGWDLADAQVVCHQLGFQGAMQATSSSSTPFGPNSHLPRTWMDNVACNGTELTLTACGNTTTSGPCNEDAAVICNGVFLYILCMCVCVCV